MKRFLILCLVLLCFAPLASAYPACGPWDTPAPENILPPLCSILDYGNEITRVNATGIGNSWKFDYQANRAEGQNNGICYTRDANGDLTSPHEVHNYGPTYNEIFLVYYNSYDCTGTPHLNYMAWLPSGVNATLMANFTASPLNATAPAYIAFTDTSTNTTGTCTYNWSFSPDSGVMAGVGGLEQESPTIYFTEEGNYTVSHGVSCIPGSDVETKTDYIRITNSSGWITTCFAAIDALSGFQLSGANFQMYDVENTSWTNATSSATGSECISTESDHTINTYTDMLGYDDGELLGSIPRASPDYPVLMFPANATNVSAGNVTLYVTVRDMYAPGLPISGAQVDMTYNFPETEQKITGVSGMVSFVVPNQTTIYLAAQKAGYVGKSASVDSGTGSGGDASISTTIYLPLKTITTAPTQTTLPGGGTPTPQVTYLAHCDPSAADYDEALCRSSKGGVGLNILADYMDDLILLCIFVTIMYLLGFKLGS